MSSSTLNNQCKKQELEIGLRIRVQVDSSKEEKKGRKDLKTEAGIKTWVVNKTISSNLQTKTLNSNREISRGDMLLRLEAKVPQINLLTNNKPKQDRLKEMISRRSDYIIS
jgi:hypothetical protein